MAMQPTKLVSDMSESELRDRLVLYQHACAWMIDTYGEGTVTVPRSALTKRVTVAYRLNEEDGVTMRTIPMMDKTQGSC
jgi:hypothetical protein